MAVQRPTRASPDSPRSRYTSQGADVVLPKNNLAGKAKAARPGSSLKSGEAITNTLDRYQANAINAVQTKTSITDIIRTLIQEDGLFSSAANAMVALSTGRYRIAGLDASGAMSLQVAAAAYALMDQFSLVNDYSEGYNDKPGMATLLSTLQMDVITSGGCGAELVLDPQFGPNRLVPVGYSSVIWEAKGNNSGRYPTQKNPAGGDPISLNIPTVFIGEHNRSADESYAVSLLRPGLSHTINFNSFLEDTHRSLNRTGHSRLVATITAEKVSKALTEAQRRDPKQVAEAYAAVKAEVEAAIADLEPEDAIVAFDSVIFDVKDTGGSKQDYTGMLTTLGNLLGASLKTPASVTGMRAGGGQGLSNAETLVYLKTTQATRPPVEEVISRALTLGIRLQGVDGSVSFEFMPIDLRPDSELEAYAATKQKRVLELLSYGVINDAHACWELGVRPQNFSVALAGTGFYTAKTETAAVPDTSRVNSADRAAQPDTPAQSGGADQ